MPDGKRQRRRRGRRGGSRPPGPDAQQNEAAPQDAEPVRDERPMRRDSRRAVRGDAASNGPPGPSGIRRAPMPQDGPPRRQRDDRGRRGGGDDRGRRGGGDDRRPREDRPSRTRGEDRGLRVFEPPVPQDPRSMELGAVFREAQMALRDARKALDKRRAEYSDEPEWLVAQLAAAEESFAAAADVWAQHLETTGRKVVRQR